MFRLDKHLCSRGAGGARARRRSLAGLTLGLLTLLCMTGASTSNAQQPFIGEIRIVPYNFAPLGWAFCDGQTMSIAENTALFQLIGTTYGGDGQTTFNLPDLRSRVPVGMGAGPGLSNYVIGEVYGRESVTLTTNQLPAHSHSAAADPSIGSSDRPAGGLPARDGAGVPHYGPNAVATMSPLAIGSAGGNQAHENRPPFLVQHYIIALEGIFPSQNAPEPPVSAKARKSPAGPAGKVRASAKSSPTGTAK